MGDYAINPFTPGFNQQVGNVWTDAGGIGPTNTYAGDTEGIGTTGGGVGGSEADQNDNAHFYASLNNALSGDALAIEQYARQNQDTGNESGGLQIDVYSDGSLYYDRTGKERVINIQGKDGWKPFDLDNANQGGYPVGLRQFVAITVGEAAGNPAAARGIGSTLINRIDAAGSSLYDPNWKEASIHIRGLGGTVSGNYQIIRNPNEDYSDIMNKMSMTQIMNSSNPGIQAALDAYRNWGTIDYSKGALFWNASKQQYSQNIGVNFQNVLNGTSVITTTLGNTTFFAPSH